MVTENQVTKVVRPAYERYGSWWVDVECNIEGRIDERSIMVASKAEADQIDVGYSME